MAPPKFCGLSGRPLSLLVSTIATTGFVLFGYDQGVMSGIISAAPFNDMFPATRDNSTMQGFTTAIYEIGCLFGAMFILGVGDLLGRRRAIIIGGAIMFCGVIIQITSMSNATPFAQFIVGRVVMGVGNGINTSTIPTYQAECSRTTNRGLLICIEGGVIAFGTCVAYWIDYGASYGPDNFTWRFPIAFQIIFALIISIPMYFLPESPRWLLTHERYEEAEIVISALRGYELDSTETALERDIIVDSIRASGGFAKSTPYKTLFTNGKTQHFRRMMLGASSQLMQQIGGCNAVIYYFPILFQKSIGQTHNMALLMGGVNMIVYSIFATVSWFVIERVGRRKLFLIGTVGQMTSMIITFACLIPGTPTAAKGAAVGLFTYIASFGATWLPLPWLYPAEVNPIKTRAKANAVSTCSNWLFNFLIVMVTPIMITNIGWGTYLFFAVVNACFLPVIWIFYPETANRSLEEIDIIFAKGSVENMSYVKAAKEMPFLSDAEVEREALRYGLIETAQKFGDGEMRHRGSKDSEKPSGNESDGVDQVETAKAG
ncbi:putative hexose carrier protein [Cryphonectria parasitica EP155]|uniref:Hexose carrier protein n=1 Tax=Cryphonectria parasitica (strain ATCC 38755 / EP155) TaxID=660469 RepID=A0A9P5CQU0_CRYP1|nr:putative hexose carrier protein [Cryphonectria parasitica EP155]KAF3766817.1 putative hexose carrier protein [Cryphonectria parasitica EP155]